MDKELTFTEFFREPGAVLPALSLVGCLPGLVHKSVYIPCKQLHSWYSMYRMKIINGNDTSEHIKHVFWWESSFIYERECGGDVCMDSFLCVPGRAWEQGHDCFIFVLPPCAHCSMMVPAEANAWTAWGVFKAFQGWQHWRSCSHFLHHLRFSFLLVQKAIASTQFSWLGLVFGSQ